MTAGSASSEQPVDPTTPQPMIEASPYDASAGFDVNELLAMDEAELTEVAPSPVAVEAPPIPPVEEVQAQTAEVVLPAVEQPAPVAEAIRAVEPVQTVAEPVVEVPVAAVPEIVQPIPAQQAVVSHILSKQVEAEALVTKAYGDTSLLPKVAAVMTQLRHENTTSVPTAN